MKVSKNKLLVLLVIYSTVYASYKFCTAMFPYVYIPVSFGEVSHPLFNAHNNRPQRMNLTRREHPYTTVFF